MSIETRKTWLAVGATALLASGVPGFVAPGLMQTAQAQNQTITGTVIDEFGEPISGANIRVKGTSRGAVTDLDGKFSLNANAGETLEISFLGYAMQNVKAANNMKVTLKEDSQSLDDVVVVGYGVQKKKLVTGATVQVKGDDLAKLNTTNALGGMASSTPGVQITQASAQPGKSFNVFIRGKGTIGDNSPLYVIDGVAGGNLDGINPNDIESIDVLKDAASSAIYGSRAANGVILVTTKQGKAGKVELTYNGSTGWSNVYKRPQLLNAQQYMTIIDEYSFNTTGKKVRWTGYDESGNYVGWIPESIYNKVTKEGWEGEDWWGDFENKNAVQQNHSVALTGGNDRSKFAMSYTYTGNEGIMGADMASFYNRHTFRINSDHVLLKVKDFDAITIGENVSIGYNKSHDLAEDGMYWSYIHSLLQTSPLVPRYADNGENYYFQDLFGEGERVYGKDWNDVIFSNPWENLTKGGFNSMAESRNFNVSATGFITIQPIKGLKWRTQLNYSLGAGAYRSYSEPRSSGSSTNTVKEYGVNQSAWLNNSYSIQNTLSYDLPVLAGNKITVLVGQSFESTGWSTNLSASNSVQAEEQNATLRGWKSAWLKNISMSSKANYSGNPNDDEYLASWFGRMSWDLHETYMATVTFRADGSSIFAEGHRWGYFPSVSAGWVVTNEGFMENTQSWMDFLKLRASWGQNGNNKIAKYQYLSTIALSGSAGDTGYKFADDLATTISGKPQTGAYANIVPNPELTWETSEQLDLGIDARFLDSRLGLNFDWYKKTTKDWLIGGAHLGIEGSFPAMINGGEVENKGVEIALNWNDRVGKDFRYNIGVNFAKNKNEVTDIANSTGFLNGTYNVLSQGTDYIARVEIGKPIGYFRGMSHSGIWQNQAQIEAARAEGKAVLDDAKPGDCIWDDWNGDGVISYTETPESDKHQIGDPNPHVTLGLNLGLSWKGVDFSVSGAGAFGMQIMRSYRSYGDAPYQNYDTSILKRWHGEGTSNSVPRMSGNGDPNTIYVSDVYLEDADYFKISNVTLGYDIKSIWKACPLQQLRFYVQASNLYTFTGYTGLDPEVGSAGGANNWMSGVDLGLYPPSRTWTIGASIKF